ncbi:MAG: hypothetical protein IH936_03565 [Acidobacteria bacterium]|nr:hypothetical protein [Acidobacteriota bacterium]
MGGLIKLAILAAVVYFGYTQLLPRYRAHRESQAAHEEADQDSQQAHHCVSVAESVSSDFAGEIRQFSRPPVDAGMWSTFMIQTSGQLSSADSACRCPHEACTSAAAALLEQRRLLNRFDAMVRGTSTGISNPAVSLERINNLLARARSEAGC